MGGGHKTQVSAIRVSPDGKEAISISSDIAHVWNLATFERLRKMQINPQTPLVDLCYLNDGQTATIFRNFAIFIWKGEQCLLQIKQPAEANFKISRMIFSQETRQLIVAGKSDLIMLYSLETRKISSIMQISGIKKVKSLAVVSGMPEHLFILADSVVRILNIADCEIQLTLNDEREPVFKMGLANEWLALISDQGTTDFFHLPTIKAELAPLESSLP